MKQVLSETDTSLRGWDNFDKQMASNERVLAHMTADVKGLDRATVKADGVKTLLRTWTEAPNLRMSTSSEITETVGKVIKKGKNMTKGAVRLATKPVASAVSKRLPRAQRAATKVKKGTQAIKRLGKRLMEPVNPKAPRFHGVKVSADLPSTRAGLVKLPIVDAWVDDVAYSVRGSEPTSPNWKGTTPASRAELAILDKKVDRAMANAADQGLTSRAAFDKVVKDVPESRGYIVSSEQAKGGDLVNVKVKDLPKKKPPVSLGKRFFGAIPLVGVAIDVNEAYKDYEDGEYLKALAHGGDALLGASIIGDVFNIGANVAGYDGAFTALVESDALEDLAGLDLVEPEEIKRINEDPTSFVEYGGITGGGPGGGMLV
jgi:hypothetical protein